MEAVTTPIMQLKFKALGAKNWQVALIITTIPQAVYSFFAPVISFKSDRFRSRLGRRIPFLLFTVPILAVGLIILGFGDRLGLWVHAHLHLSRLSPSQTVMCTFGVLLAVFTFFNTYTTTVFWYLFNDVVPENMLARFMAWFRLVSTLSTAFYQFFVFPYSESHSTAIFIGAAALYLVGFGLMCLNVHEGQYPPPPAYVGKQAGAVAAIKTFTSECHSHRIYWYLWLCTFIGCIGAGVTTFDLFFKQAIGLDLVQIGRINGTLLIAVSVLIVASGWMGDRYGPIRVVLAAQVLQWVLLTPATLVWLFWHPEPGAIWTIHLPFLQHVPFMHQFAIVQVQQVFLISLVIFVGIAAPVNALNSMWDPPMLMRTFPRSRYGQFCSTNALWRTAGWMLGGFLAGFCLDKITPWVGKDRAYYYTPIWSFVFGIPGFILFLKFYQGWKRHGSDAYVAPVPGEEPVAATSLSALTK